MKIRVPKYFTDFKCIADKCRDSCCIGWEIDVDETARQKYESLDCDIGREITEKTSHGYFPLQENGRCAFLDGKGLCRIISTLGEGYLCDICREHPRYYNVAGGVTEGGLGLGCEEAARIILAQSELPETVEIEHTAPILDEENTEVSEKIRDALFGAIFTEDVRNIAGLYKEYAIIGDSIAFDLATSSKVATDVPSIDPRAITDEELTDLYDAMLSLVNECESLSDEWDGFVARARMISPKIALSRLGDMRGLIYYFTHRYVVGGIDDMTLGGRILFAFASALTVAAISEILCGEDAEILAATAYSKNIEYSTDNVDFILENLEL